MLPEVARRTNRWRHEFLSLEIPFGFMLTCVPCYARLPAVPAFDELDVCSSFVALRSEELKDWVRSAKTSPILTASTLAAFEVAHTWSTTVLLDKTWRYPETKLLKRRRKLGSFCNLAGLHIVRLTI